MLDLAKHIVNKSDRFEPEKFEDQYETALIDLISQKRAGKPITPKERPAAGNIVDLMEALPWRSGRRRRPRKRPSQPRSRERPRADGRRC
jgi:DNA end-binding protein Ku